MRCTGRHVMCPLLLVFSMWLVLASETTTSTVLSASNISTKASTDNETTTTSTASKPKEWYILDKADYDKISKAAMTVTLLGAVLNFVVILIMAADPLKILRKGPWITILNLAIADLIACISGFCIWGAAFFKNIVDQNELLTKYMAVNNFGWGFGYSSSFLILTFLIVQIYAITKFPLKSRSWFQTSKVVLICMAIWIVAFLMGLGNLASQMHVEEITIYNIYIARIGILEVAVLVQVFLNIQVIVEIIRSGRNVGNPQNNKHKALAKTVMILTIILILTAFPYFILKQIEFTGRSGRLGGDRAREMAYNFSYIYAPIALLNYAINPILYSLRLPDYRKTLLALVCKRQKKNFSPTKTTTSKFTNMISLRSQRASDTSCGKNNQPSANQPI